MIAMDEIHKRREEITHVAARYGRATCVSLAWPRGDATEDSDLDLVVRFESGRSLGQKLMEFSGKAVGLPSDAAQPRSLSLWNAETMTVFADTSYFIALVNGDAEMHEEAARHTADFTGEVVTTEWVLNEFANFLAKPPNRQLFVSIVRNLRDNPRVRIVPATNGTSRSVNSFLLLALPIAFSPGPGESLATQSAWLAA